MIVAERLSKRYPGAGKRAPALDDVSFSAERAEVLALLGPNGAGKSTAVRILATLLRPTGGRALVAGFDVVAEPHKVRRSIGVALQSVGIDAGVPVAALLELHLRLHGYRRRTARRRVADLLASAGLVSHERVAVGTLSGGMRRRLDLALAIAHDPPVLFLDEPATGLDPSARRELWSDIRRLSRDGTTILLTTQHLEEAEALADRVAILHRGRIARDGSVQALKQAHARRIVELTFATPEDAAAAAQVVGRQASAAGSRLTQAVDSHGVDRLRAVVGSLQAHGLDPLTAALAQPSLEDVYLHATASADNGHG